MKIHEYQAKAILAKYGVPVPRGEVAFTVDEAEAAAKKIGGSVVVKAQIHAGGRGKGGGVKVAKDATQAAEIAKNMSLVAAVFLKLIKMIIGPLVLSTLIVGIGHMGDAASVGRVGAKTMAWFVSASVVSLVLGLAMVDLLKPGVGIVVDQGASAANLTTQAFSIDNFIDHLVPTSIFKRSRLLA